jgi:hypothetical protein
VLAKAHDQQTIQKEDSKKKLSYKTTRRRHNSHNHRQKKKKTPYFKTEAIFDKRGRTTPQETTRI